jgi:peptidyl-prolyl cis-trans isomerase C
MKLLSKKLALIFSGLLIVLLVSHCNSTTTSQSAAKSPADPNIVAQIDQYVITKGELQQKLLLEIYPNSYNFFIEESSRTDAKSMLQEMIAEKAMIIEARKQGYLEDEAIKASVKREQERRLISLLLQNYLTDRKDKITATEAEIEQRMKADPNSNRTRVKAIIENTKARNIVSQYYNQLYEKFHVKKLSENLPKVIQIHDRLLNHPKTPQKIKYIRNSQIRDEMTPEEKSIVLATYDYGQVTLEDWLNTLCESAPPSRPKNLNTPTGIEQLLNRALMIPIYATEAKLQNLDKDETFLKQIREFEDVRLLSKVKSDKYKQVKEPTDEEILTYYNNNKEVFRTGRFMKINQIWCENLKTAKQIKGELDKDKDFEAAKQEYSLVKNSKASNAYPSSEGLFWKDLWHAEPNDIVGPIKGFNNRQIKWRIVKILEKKPGEIKEYSKDMNNTIKNGIMTERRKAIITEYERELLKKYPYKIYKKRIKNIDPLDIQ